MADAVHDTTAPQAQTDQTDPVETKPKSGPSASALAFHARDVADKILELRQFLECAWMATEAIGHQPHTDALQYVLDHVSKEMEDLAERVAPTGVCLIEAPADGGPIVIMASDVPPPMR